MYHLLAGSPLSPPVNYINEETRDDKRARRGGTTWKLITDNSLFFLRPACFGDNGRIRRNTSFSTNFLVITVKHGFEKFRSCQFLLARLAGWKCSNSRSGEWREWRTVLTLLRRIILSWDGSLLAVGIIAPHRYSRGSRCSRHDSSKGWNDEKFNESAYHVSSVGKIAFSFS